jgi:hypothetical protein
MDQTRRKWCDRFVKRERLTELKTNLQVRRDAMAKEVQEQIDAAINERFEGYTYADLMAHQGNPEALKQWRDSLLAEFVGPIEAELTVVEELQAYQDANGESA